MYEFFVQLRKAAREYFYGKSIRKEVDYALRQLIEKPVFLDFLSHRWTSMNRGDTVDVIQKAVDDGIVTWQEFGTTVEQINKFYQDQFSNLISLYDLSFPMGHWKSYSHAARGLRSFYDIAYGPNESLLDKSVFCSIRRRFAQVIYDFLRTEGPDPKKQIIQLGDEEATLILMHTHHYCEEELWIVRRPSAVTSNAAVVRRMRSRN